MQTSETLALFPNTQLTWKEITPELLNAKALELGRAGAALVQAGQVVVEKAIELGGLLEIKAAHVEKTGTPWAEWCDEKLEFSRASADNYRRLYRHRGEIASALAEGKVNSIRQALAILQRELPKAEPVLPGLEVDEKAVMEAHKSGESLEEISMRFGITVEAVQEIIQRLTPAPKTEGLFGRIWKLFLEPAKVPEPEKDAFLRHTAASCKLAKEHGWKLPGVTIDITTTETNK